CDRGCQRCLAGINVRSNRACARSTRPGKCEARGDDKSSRWARPLPNDDCRCVGSAIGRRISERDLVKPVSSGESIVNGVIIALTAGHRSEEHTSELQSRSDLVCRLLLEKKKTNTHPPRRRPPPFRR